MSDHQSRFKDEMNRGHTAAWDQDWKGAAQHYRQALEEIPEDANALVSLGLALFELGSYDEAIEQYSRAMAISPEDPLAFDKASQLYEMLGKNQEAIYPSLLASELYLKQGNASKSIECLVRVVRVDAENLPAHSRLALIYERTGRVPRAVAEYLMVASIFQHKHDVSNAIQAVEHAIEISPSSREAKEALSLISEGGILPKPKSIELEKPAVLKPQQAIVEEVPGEGELSELDPITEAHQLAMATLANLVIEGDQSHSLEYHEDILADQPGGSETRPSLSSDQRDGKVIQYLQQAINYWSQDSQGAAADELEQALESGLNHPAAYFKLGAVRAQEDRLESAIRYLKRALDAPEFGLASRLIIARTFRYMDRLSDAATNYLEALRLADMQLVPEDQSSDMSRMYAPIIEAETKQTDPVAKNRLCDMIDDLLVRPGWQTYITQARGEFQIEVEGVPIIPIGEMISNPQGNRIVESVRQIHQYARSGYWRSAMEEAFFAIQFAPTYLPLHIYMGELLLKQDHLSGAVEKFGAIAKTYRARGEFQNAIRVLQRLIKAAPMDLKARNQLISLHEELGHDSQAIEEKIDLAGVYYNLADLSHAREVYLDAYKLAQNSEANQELMVEILYHLADIEMQSLDWKHAQEIYTEIQSIKPDDHQASEKLIDINLRLGHNQQAIKEIEEYLAILDIADQGISSQAYLEKLVEDYPERVALHQIKADLHRKFDQVDLAVQEFDAIGELLLNAGDRQGAVEAIERIVALNPSNKDEYLLLIDEIRAGD